MATEDHPVDYLDFEGIIPKGQYGGGTVMVWDIGTYEVIEGNYYKGFLRFYLNGSKLKGEWTIKRIIDGKDERDTRDKWHLIKTGRNTRVVSKQRDDQSALTQRTMMQIASAADAVWQSNRR
jgi:bifunctional non-homologous end joining protein LigD